MTKILFITANRLGDAVLSTGVLAQLVKDYPDAAITVACGPYASGLFRAVPRLEKIIILKKRTWNRHWIGLWQECVSTRWDMIVDLRNSLVTRLLSAEKKFYGGKNSGQHKVVELAKVIGASTPPTPYVWIDEAADREAATIIPAGRPILALGPAANWACKQWPIENFAVLAKKLIVPGGILAGAAVLVIADDKERTQITPLLQALPTEDRIELLGRELTLVAACLKRATLFVGNDSGLMHLSAAVGTKTLGLFGPGYEEIYGPWGPHAASVRTIEKREDLLAKLAQSPDKQICLMTGLSVERVEEAIGNLNLPPACGRD
jgi:lipopolysaccharide export system permease protein